MKLWPGEIRVWVISAGMAFSGVALAAEPAKPASDNGGEPAKTDSKSDAKPDAKAKPKRAGQTEALNKAIAELTKEYKDFQANPDSSSLRTSSDYFKSSPPADTTTEDILAVVNGNLSGPPSQVAYVKWQLLSACPAKFEGDQAKIAKSALAKAPSPQPAIASTPQIRQQLDRAVQGKKTSEVPSDVVDGFKKEQSKIDLANEPIIGYRMALWQRLPTSEESLLAGFEQLVIRLNNGIDAGALKKQIATISTDVRSWAAVDAKPDQIGGMLATVKKLKSYKAPTSYYAPSFSSKPDQPAKWAAYPTDFGKLLDDLETNLTEAAKNGGGGLKFKDDKKK